MRARFSLSVSVFVIVRDGPHVLLLRRAKTGWEDGCFSLPAGAHDGGESLECAAARELGEETGLEVLSKDLQMTHLLHCKAGDSGSEWLGAFFVATKWSGVPQLMERDKHDQLDWFPINDLPSNLIPYVRQGIGLSNEGVRFSAYGW